MLYARMGAFISVIAFNKKIHITQYKNENLKKNK